MKKSVEKELRLKKINPKDGDLYFIYCENANSKDIADLRSQVKRLHPEIHVIFTNYEIKVKRTNVSKTETLHLTCKEGSIENFFSLRDAVSNEIQ
jgi:hypothetical protein